MPDWDNPVAPPRRPPRRPDLTEPPPSPAPADAGSSFFRQSRAPRSERAAAAPGSATLAPGTPVAHFVLRGFIARGGMGQVWEAEDTELRRTVALKLVLPELLDSRALDFFAREARAGGRLAHPNIVTTLASGKHEGLAWIAQELVEGSWTLRDFLDAVRAEDSVPEGYYRSVALLVAQIADGLEAAHEAGVIHRDVKPANILITRDDRPKLTDFGLARVVDESMLSTSGEVAGSWAYMSPEQVAARRSEIDHRTDVFSLGVVLYELLALRRPFDGDTTQQIAEQISKVDPPDASNVRSQCPRELAIICNKALEKSKAARYPSAAALAADLRAHVANEPIVAQAPGPLARAVKWSRRNPTPAAVTAVSLVALAVVSILLAVNARQAEENAVLAASAAAERDDVLRLAAAQDLVDLVASQASLWPPHPERIDDLRAWLAEADALLSGLPIHRAKLDALRARALPPAETDAREHPDARRLSVLEGNVAARRRALAVRRGEAEPATHELDVATLPDDVREWNAIAWDLVTPRRLVFGQEARGVAILEAAIGATPPSEHPALLETLTWAHFALGDDARARESARAALAAAPASDEGKLERLLATLEVGVGSFATEEGRATEETELAEIEAEIERLRRNVSERVDWTFADEDDSARWWMAQLVELIDDLESLERDLVDPGATTPEHGWSVGARLRFAERLESGHAAGGDLDRAWSEQLPAIRAAHPELELGPQIGLLPLGADPDSGLFEFAHLASGEPAERDAAGRLILTEETGVVLVLVPAGEFLMGAQTGDPSAPGYDPQAYEDESPVHPVRLSAFLVSKYELTQGQWLRAAGANPSYHQPPGRLAPSLLHPVEQVSWARAESMLVRLGLSLPTEAQWEYAARAGTRTPWSFGAAREDLRGRVNIADKTAADDGAEWPDSDSWPDHEDGGIVHTEVGRYPANAFGLHDVHGNVWEWCVDQFDVGFYSRSPLVDPVVPDQGYDVHVHRGGAFDGAALYTRSSMRNYGSSDFAEYNIGVRPARALDSTER